MIHKFKTGATVKVIPKVSAASRRYAGRICSITKATDDYYRLDLEGDEYSGGVWLDEVEAVLDSNIMWRKTDGVHLCISLK